MHAAGDTIVTIPVGGVSTPRTRHVIPATATGGFGDHKPLDAAEFSRRNPSKGASHAHHRHDLHPPASPRKGLRPGPWRRVALARWMNHQITSEDVTFEILGDVDMAQSVERIDAGPSFEIWKAGGEAMQAGVLRIDWGAEGARVILMGFWVDDFAAPILNRLETISRTKSSCILLLDFWGAVSIGSNFQKIMSSWFDKNPSKVEQIYVLTKLKMVKTTFVALSLKLNIIVKTYEKREYFDVFVKKIGFPTRYMPE